MAIYRGTGGSGDASGGVTLSEIAAYTVRSETAETNAETAETNAAASEAAAAISESNAATSESNASTSETNAAASAAAALVSENNAAASEAAVASYVADQAGNSGKYLTTNGSAVSWTNVGSFDTFALTGDQVQVGEGGTGATTASGARTNLLAVGYTATTGSATIPTGTAAQRDGSPSAGYFRFNSDVAKFEGYNGTSWGSVGGGATGGGSDAVFIENDQTVTTNYTVPASKNAMSTGPVTVNSGVTVTVSGGARYVVI